MHYYGGNMMKTPLSRSNTPISRYETTKATATRPTPRARKSIRSKAQAITKQAATESHISADKSVIRSKLWGGPNTEGEGQQGNAELNANNQTAQAKTQWQPYSCRSTPEGLYPRQSAGLARSPKNLLQECGKPSSWQQKRRITWLTPPAPKPPVRAYALCCLH